MKIPDSQIVFVLGVLLKRQHGLKGVRIIKDFVTTGLKL
jgi:hypothetical protein